MKLLRLSNVSIVACLAGFVALAGFAAWALEDLRAKRASVEELRQLKERIDNFSVASDNLLVSGADPELWRAYRVEARGIRERLRDFGRSHTDALKSVDRIDGIVDALKLAGVAGAGSSTSTITDGVGPLGLPPRAHDLIVQVAGHGIAMDGALAEALAERRAAIGRDAAWVGGGFAAAALAFAALCVLAFTLIHRRISEPVRALQDTITRVRDGDLSARAAVRGHDELADLAGALNDMVSQRQHSEAKLREQQRLLEIAGRTARIGGWSVDLGSDRIVWSDVVAEIHGMPAGYSPTISEGIAFYADDSRDHVRRRFTACAEHGEPYDEEFEIVNARDERAWVRSVGLPVLDRDGHIVRVEGAFQDITAQRTAERERTRLAERLQATVESITDAFFTLDHEWRFDYVNGEAERLLQRAHSELIGRNVWATFPEAVGTRIEREYRRAMADQVTVALEEFYEPLGKWFDIRAYPSSEGLTVYFRDTTEHHQMVERLVAQEAKLRSSRDELAAALETRKALINSLPAHIALLDADGTVRDVNDRWRRYAAANGNTDADAGVGRNYIATCEGATGDCAADGYAVAAGLRSVLAGRRESFWREYACHSPSDRQWFRVHVNRLRSGEDHADELGAVVMHVDITERKLAEHELNRLAYEDHLTGVASRNGFAQSVAKRLHADGWQPDGQVVMLDVQRQRDINETHGFAAGDDLLCQIARRLQEAAGEQAVIGRAGGDEFFVYLPPSADRDPSVEREALAEAFAARFPVGNTLVEIGARFGYTSLGEPLRPVERLLREAEMALYHTRDNRKLDDWAVYTTALDEATHQRIRVTRELRQALEQDQFELHFQPKVRLDTGELIAAEALLRWSHPERGLQPPAEFIPIAEQSQLIAPIGEWVLNEACRQLREWLDQGLDVVRVSLNVSIVQLAAGDFPRVLRRALQAHSVAPKSLTLEITESVFEEESELLHRQLHELHDTGVRLSLDDFGTGYSSLKYLQQYPFDEIKIDKGFVLRMLDDRYSARVVSTVVAIAEALGTEVVAEGVESKALSEALVGLGCHLGQGFYYSLPLASEDFRGLLEKHSALPLVTQAAADDRHRRES